MKRLSLFTEFDKYYKGSDLQKIVSHKPLPFKYTINGTDCYFYNADLFGLFEWKIKKDGLTTNDFIDDYKKGFEAGLLHLETSERIELKDLKSKDLREGTISQLQYILFEREFKTGSKGLLDLVFNKVPLIFTEKTIYDFGYWNGIIYSIDELCENAGLRLDDLKALPPQQTEKPKPELNKIWLSEPKISVQDLLTLGVEKGIWNDEYQIITAKGSLYGTGKTMLGSLFIALKGYAISDNIDYKVAGKAFCKNFNISVNDKTKEPYKAFSSGNEKLIRELKRAFNIK